MWSGPSDEHAAWARAAGGPRSGGLAGPGARPPWGAVGAVARARGGTPAARSDAPGARSWPSRRHRALPRRMPRALAPGLSLLLMAAGLAFAATPPLEAVSSWLSSDLQWAVCSPAPGTDSGPLCPPPCPANSTKSTQCLYYLQESHKEEVCGPDLGPERRRDVLHGLRMRHCCEHAVDQALPEDAFNGGKPCRDMLDALIDADQLASRIACGHAHLLTRYDCGQTYSIAHRCHDCKVHHIHSLSSSHSTYIQFLYSIKILFTQQRRHQCLTTQIALLRNFFLFWEYARAPFSIWPPRTHSYHNNRQNTHF